MAFDAKRDRGLKAFDASHLFKSNTTRVAIRRGAYLRGYAYAFIELFSPQLGREVIDASLAGKGEMYEL
jgi:LysR family cys regulon transcriptional activator